MEQSLRSQADLRTYSMRAQALFFATVSVFLPVTILLGWVLNVPVMRSFVPGFVPTSPMTAFCFVLLGASVILAQYKGLAKWLSPVLIGSVLILCAWVGFSYLGLNESSLDKQMFAHKLELTEAERLNISQTEHINVTKETVRMAPHTTIGFCMIAVAMLLSRSKKDWVAKVAQGLAFGVILIASMVLFGYTLSTGVVKSFGQEIPMAFATALNFLLAAVLVFMVRRSDGLLYPLIGKSAAASFSRRLLVVGFFLPPIITTIRVNVTHFGLLSGEVSAILATSMLVFAFVVTFWWASFVLKRSEEERELVNEGLRDRAIELEKAHQEADRANRAKSEFLSRMSHELRTPMNAVMGYAQLLELPPHDEEVQEGAKAILKGGRHLLELIDEVLDISKIEIGKLKISLEVVHFPAVVRHCLELVKPTGDAKQVSVAYEAPLDEKFYVRADRQRMIQVVLNLLSNAIKYNKPGGEVRLWMTQADGLVQLHVADTGVGIKEESVEKLFIPFERLGDQFEEGTGLGLALSKNLIELMGGRLFLESTSDAGSTFTAELQLAASVELDANGTDQAAADLSLNPGAHKLRIVYVEDNLSNLQLLKKVFLKVGGVELIPAMQASVGLDLIRSQLPDMVLLDLHLPDAHGSMVLHELKSHPETAGIEVIVISADATENEKKKLIELGAKSFLTKPIDLHTLLAEVNEVKARLC
jgi:signal transduction histidine kinase/CheY-like chemotaxis protein